MKGPVCAYCGKDIEGKYFQDYWGSDYCAGHLNRVSRCDYCSRLLGERSSRGALTYSDGRKICGICSSGAVNDPAEGLKLLKQVHGFLETLGIKISPFKPEFFLIDRSRLRQLSRGEQQGFAVFDRELRNGKIVSFSMKIFILKGLPRDNFMSTCAHELMHIWFYSRGITDAAPALVEGSCNMAAYLFLKNKKTPEAEYLIRGFFADKSKTYGAGFRKVEKLVHRKGIAAWLDHAASRKRI